MEAPSDQELIIAKGKRTKRQRQISPFRLSIADSPSSGDDNISTTTSSDDQFLVHTKEEEKIANYLIMLSKGHFSREEENIYQVEEGHHVNVVNINNDNNNNNNSNNYNNIPKFNSKRYMETTTGSGKAGFYVYECKTCNRTFPSFQALGGHRASHKKPKNMMDQQEKKMNFGFSVSSDDDYESPRATNNTNRNNNNTKVVSSLALQLSTSKSYYGNISKAASKVHECMICGAEFTSGQALGGHMRRHRGSVTGATSGLLLNQMTSESEDTDRNTMNNNNNNNNVGVSLDLDLNLPAPENDCVEGNKLQFIKSNNSQDKQNQEITLRKDQGHENGDKDEEGTPNKRSKSSHDSTSPLVFSVPALVDCHY